MSQNDNLDDVPASPQERTLLTIEACGLTQADAVSHALQIIGMMIKSPGSNGYSCGGLSGNAQGALDVKSDGPAHALKPNDSKLDLIRQAVSNEFRLHADLLSGPSKREEFRWPRFIGMSLSRELTQSTLLSIAEFYGRTDHGTAYYATKRVRERISIDDHFAHRYEEIKSKCEERLRA